MFIRHLEDCVKCPAHLQIYDLARKILQNRHQIEFAQKTPENTIDVIKINREFPIELSGGAERGLPVWVQHSLFCIIFFGSLDQKILT